MPSFDSISSNSFQTFWTLFCALESNLFMVGIKVSFNLLRTAARSPLGTFTSMALALAYKSVLIFASSGTVFAGLRPNFFMFLAQNS